MNKKDAIEACRYIMQGPRAYESDRLDRIANSLLPWTNERAQALLAALSYGREAGLIAMTAALVAGASDTIASEIGKAWGTRTWALVPPRLVRAGTSGAMSLEGTAAGLLGAAALGALAIGLGLVPGSALLPVVVGSTAGALVESLLAASFEAPGTLNNDALNFINTALAAYVAVSIAGALS